MGVNGSRAVGRRKKESRKKERKKERLENIDQLQLFGTTIGHPHTVDETVVWFVQKSNQTLWQYTTQVGVHSPYIYTR